ncbi:MAG: hypothetical protein J6Y36_02510 [Treponema sp.]|nr:hypothetical protein [Treponema sp.]
MTNSKNPWKDIPLSDYEKHMSLDSVKQLQVMNEIMKNQFFDYPVKTAMVLGVAGGNGLEHVDSKKYSKVFGVDINEAYLKETALRYKNLSEILECLCIDLITEKEKLPCSELVIANLLIEYIGYDVFCNALKIIKPDYVSCVIQINEGEGFVSDSPYLHSFDRLSEVHHQMAEKELTDAMTKAGYKKIKCEEYSLPNMKKLVRLDFSKAE